MKKFLSLFMATLLFFSIVNIAEATSNIQKETIEGKFNSIISNLEGSDTTSVTYVDLDGNIYSNKSGGIKRVGKSIELLPGQNKITLSTGEILTLPTEHKDTTKQDGTILEKTGDVSIQASGGPYRRVKSNYGYRKVEGDAYTSGGSSISLETGDTAYMYLGASTDNSGEIDFGLIYSPSKNAWFPFYLYSSVMHVFEKDTDSAWGPSGISAGTKVFMRFYVSKDDQVTLYLSTPDGKSYNFVKDTSSSHDFNYNGSGVALKRLTTIGQGSENLSNGSYFKDSYWRNIKIANTTTMGNWTSSYTAQKVKYPNDDTKVITNTLNSDYNEDVDIDLHN